MDDGSKMAGGGVMLGRVMGTYGGPGDGAGDEAAELAH